jgi:hypothetical protein
MFSIVAFTALCVTILNFALTFFEKWENVATERERNAYRQWLYNPTFGISLNSSWSRAFILVFERIFGERHFSWKCFRNSCIASFISLTLVAIIFYSLNQYLITSHLKHKWQTILTYIIFSLILNIIPDYLALFKTRFILNKIGSYNIDEKVPTLRIIAVDLLLNFIISSATFFLVFLITGLKFRRVYRIQGGLTNWKTVPPMTTDLEPFVYTIQWSTSEIFEGAVFLDNIFSIFFYSTFFTSASIWIFTFSGFLIKKIGHIDEKLKSFDIGRFIKKEMIEDKPIYCLGFVLVRLVGIPVVFIAVLSSIVFLYFHH